jgi:CelD/BcsL family acetyltransferase involved in cellulose biosynthesis
VASVPVEICSGPEGLRRLSNEWLELQLSLAACPFYVRYHWYEALVGALLEEPDKIMFLALRTDGQCRGIVPLQADRPRWGLLLMRTLGSPDCDHIDLTDVLLADGESLNTWLPAMRRALRQHGVRWSALHFASVPRTGAALRVHGRHATLGVYHAPRYSCVIDCSRSYEQVAAGYSSRLRKNLKRGAQGLGRLGEVVLRRVSTMPELGPALEEFIRIEASGWKGAAGTATAIRYNEQAHNFYQALYAQADPDGTAEINLLSVGGRVVAGQLCMVSGGSRSLIKIAFDQALQKLSPGTIMLDLLIRRMCDEAGPAELNLVTGTAWMDEWGPRRVPVGDLWLFRNRWAGAVVAAGVRLYTACRGLGGRQRTTLPASS